MPVTMESVSYEAFKHISQFTLNEMPNWNSILAEQGINFGSSSIFLSCLILLFTLLRCCRRLFLILSKKITSWGWCTTIWAQTKASLRAFGSWLFNGPELEGMAAVKGSMCTLLSRHCCELDATWVILLLFLCLLACFPVSLSSVFLYQWNQIFPLKTQTCEQRACPVQSGSGTLSLLSAGGSWPLTPHIFYFLLPCHHSDPCAWCAHSPLPSGFLIRIQMMTLTESCFSLSCLPSGEK